MSTPDIPTQDEVLGYSTTLSNWGRWGEDDQLGTLNLITPQVRRRGAGAVRHGVSVSCAWEVAPGDGDMQRATMAFPQGAALMPGLPGGDDAHWGTSAETLSFGFHGREHTHLDSLCHMFWDGLMYNGRPAELVTPEAGATWGSVTPAADRMVTRGVLLDVAAVRGVAWLEPGEPVLPRDLEAAEERQGVRAEPGDAVLLRTGADRQRREHPGAVAAGDFSQPGWHAACLPWLHARSVAYIGSDVATDVNPSGYAEVFMPVHSLGIVAMGLWLIDNCDLTEVAAVAERLQQWDFQLAVCPIRFVGTSGSPVNPVATF